MSTRLIHAVATTEQSDELHLARLLLLLHATGGRSGKKSIEGIMKLAKLDFLLRYPNALARALRAAGQDEQSAKIRDYERNTIESRMIRFKYGPWDSRYRRWIALLVAKGLGTAHVEGRTVHVELTDAGVQTALALRASDAFSDLAIRSRLVARLAGGLSATRAKEYVYNQFPELLDMRWGEEITL